MGVFEGEGLRVNSSSESDDASSMSIAVVVEGGEGRGDGRILEVDALGCFRGVEILGVLGREWGGLGTRISTSNVAPGRARVEILVELLVGVSVVEVWWEDL